MPWRESCKKLEPGSEPWETQRMDKDQATTGQGQLEICLGAVFQVILHLGEAPVFSSTPGDSQAHQSFRIPALEQRS